MLAIVVGQVRGAKAAGFERVDAAPGVWRWTDTCNVYVVKEGDAAVLIDLGDGSVLERLGDLGITKLEWVLLTHHHREQCQGDEKLATWGVPVAAPEAERELLENPAKFRAMNVSLGDPFTIHGSSFVRPPIQSIAVRRGLKPDEVFEWRGRHLICLETPGNSPGALTYLLKTDSGTIAFSGDVMLNRGKMHTWFDTEWDYGFAAGIKALRASVTRLSNTRPTLLLPSHGPLIPNPEHQLAGYADKLAHLEPLYLRGYDPEGGSVAYQDKVSHPTSISNVWQVSPHLFKFKRPNFWPNFSIILADDGHALVSDCGLLDEQFLDTALEGLRQNYGLKSIDALIISHMHGDHFLEAPHLRARWGTPIWALDNMVDKMEHPERFDYAAPIQAYGKTNPDGSAMLGVHVDHALKPGEEFQWEGYRLKVDWMPGQTEFALCLQTRIDGRQVAFTGDNIFGDPDNPAQTGHEAMVAHNSAILEEGYIYGAEFLKKIHPDLLMGGHSFVMDHPAAFIERYRRWSYAMRDAFRSLSSENDYRCWFDPFWLRAQPYRVWLNPGKEAKVTLHLRNFQHGQQHHRIEIHTPPGLTAEPSFLEGTMPPDSKGEFPICIRMSAEAVAKVRLVGLDLTIDGKRYGERFDFVVGPGVAPPDPK